VNPGAKRGVVKFVGRCEALPPGFWIGVQFDEPVGMNNGTVKGVKLFECNDGYGSLQRPKNVSCGDFPPLDDVDFSEDEI
jgi:tubulin-folding cofactor B